MGIYDGEKKETDTTPMFFRYDYFDEARRTGAKGLVGWYTIRVKDPAQAAEVAKRVDQEFENSAAETKTEPEGAFVQAWVSQIGNIVLIVAAILGAVFFTILLVTGNTMSQAVRERTGELGVLKAIGFTNAQVMSLVLAESCLLTILGGVLGLGLACCWCRFWPRRWPACCRCSPCRRAICSSVWASASCWVWSPGFFPRSRPCACAWRTP